MSARKISARSNHIPFSALNPLALLAATLIGSTSAAQVPDDVRWQGITSAPDSIQVLSSFGGELVVGGQFTSVDGQAITDVARFDGMSTWSPLADGLSGPLFGFYHGVFALSPYRSGLAAGGAFSFAGSEPTQSAASWDGASWTALPGLPFDLERVSVLGVYGGELIAGGIFGFGGPWPHFIARWDGASWSPLGPDPMSSGLDFEPLAFAIYGGELVAGGNFSTAGGLAVNGIARWNGSTWNSLGSGMDGAVHDLVVHDGKLIACGTFSHAGGVPAVGLARWNGSVWTDLGASPPTEPRRSRS